MTWAPKILDYRWLLLAYQCRIWYPQAKCFKNYLYYEHGDQMGLTVNKHSQGPWMWIGPRHAKYNVNVRQW